MMERGTKRYQPSLYSLGEHVQHKKENFIEAMSVKNELIWKDLQELEKSFYSKYQDAATNIPVQRADVNKHSQKLTSSGQTVV